MSGQPNNQGVIMSIHDIETEALYAFEASVRKLHDGCKADDNESLDRFGQHHPVAGWVADRLDELLSTLDTDLTAAVRGES